MANFSEKLKQLSLGDTYTKTQMTAAVAGVSSASPETLDEFEGLMKEIIKNDEGRLALISVYVLDKVLIPQLGANQKQSDLGLSYKRITDLLRMVNLGTYSLPEITNLIQNNFLSAMSLGMNMQNKFQQVLTYYDDLSEEGAVAEVLANALTGAKETIGKNTLTIFQVGGDPKRLSPGVGVWLKDFLQFATSAPESDTSSLQRIKYFEANQNGKTASEADKKILLEIFRLYRWLQVGDDTIDDFIDQQAARPVAPRKAPAPALKKALPEALLKPSASTPAQSVIKPPPKKVTPVQPMSMPRVVGAGDGVNVQKRLYNNDPALNRSAGLDFEPPIEQSLPTPSPVPTKDKAIEDKLAALKKKMGK